MMIGKMLLEKGIITKEQLEKALETQSENPKLLLGEVLINLEYIKISTLVAMLEKQLDTNNFIEW